MLENEKGCTVLRDKFHKIFKEKLGNIWIIGLSNPKVSWFFASGPTNSIFQIAISFRFVKEKTSKTVWTLFKNIKNCSKMINNHLNYEKLLGTIENYEKP